MRTRTVRLIRAALLIVLCCSPDAYANREMLASAKSLYESASYQAALSQLSAIDDTELVDVVDTYRALCFLGLGREGDAEQTLGSIVTRKPLLVLSDADYSPRIVALFRDVRRKALPAAAQRLYSSARTDFENKKYVAATDGFRQTLQVIADVAPETQTATLADLKELASGFLALAEAKGAPEAPLRAPAAVAAGAAATGVVAAGGSAATLPVVSEVSTFYTLSDADVTPPVVGKWRYEPALKAGRPVRFKRVLVNKIDPRVQRPR
jgi:hypothetical protein